MVIHSEFAKAFLCFALTTIFLGVSGVFAENISVIADFEDPEESTYFTVKKAAVTAELSSDRASSGTHSVRFTWLPNKKGARNDPTSWVPLRKAYLAADGQAYQVDWSSYKEYLVDVFTPGPKVSWVRLFVEDTNGKRWDEWYKIQPKEWMTIHAKLRTIGEKVDVSAIDKISFCYTTPDKKEVVYVDNVRLSGRAIDDAIQPVLWKPAFNQSFYHSNPEREVAVYFMIYAGAGSVKDLKLRLTLKGGNGEILGTKTLTNPKVPGDVGISLLKPAMNDGETIAAIADVLDGAKVLKSQKWLITQRPPAKDEVVMRDDGVILVNGEPFLPIGFFNAPPQAFPELKRLGCNVVQSWSPVNELSLIHI